MTSIHTQFGCTLTPVQFGNQEADATDTKEVSKTEEALCAGGCECHTDKVDINSNKTDQQAATEATEASNNKSLVQKVVDGFKTAGKTILAVLAAPFKGLKTLFDNITNRFKKELTDVNELSEEEEVEVMSKALNNPRFQEKFDELCDITATEVLVGYVESSDPDEEPTLEMLPQPLDSASQNDKQKLYKYFNKYGKKQFGIKNFGSLVLEIALEIRNEEFEQLKQSAEE